MRNNRVLVWSIIGVGMVMTALAAVHHVVAGTLRERTTYLTFTRPVQLPGVTLDAGAYIFELVDPLGAPGLVRVASRDRTVGFFLGFTNDAERPRGLRLDASVSLGEASGGAAPPITVWWPIGETTGRQFIYPKR
jgi:hypothetical protein